MSAHLMSRQLKNSVVSLERGAAAEAHLFIRSKPKFCLTAEYTSWLAIKYRQLVIPLPSRIAWLCSKPTLFAQSTRTYM